MERISNIEQQMEGRAKQLAAVVLAFVFAIIQNIAPSITILPGVETSGTDLGVFIPTSGAIIFGRSVGGAAAGLGLIAVELQSVLQGSPLENIYSIGVLLNTISFSIGVFVAGLLGVPEGEEFSPRNIREVFLSPHEWWSVTKKTMASIVGVGLTNNFIYAYGSQLQEGASIGGGTTFFLQHFVTDSVVLIFTIPMTLIFYDLYQMFQTRKSELIELLYRKIDWEIPVDKAGVRILGVKLPESSFVQDKWVPVYIDFISEREEPTAFTIEGVATSRITPHIDRTPPLKKGERWRQTFFTLPTKQDTVSIRFRILPVQTPKFQVSESDETIIEFEAKTRNPRGLLSALLGFSGINFGVAGAGVVWDKLVYYFSNPGIILEEINSAGQLVVTTVILEVALFIPVILLMYRSATRTTEEQKMKLSFSNDIDDHTYEAITIGRFKEFMQKYSNRLSKLFRVGVALATIGTTAFLGFQAYMVFTVDNYKIPNADSIVILIAGIIVAWIVGIKGDNALMALNLIKDEPPPGTNHFILDFKPLAKFQDGVPTDVVLKVYNPSPTPGMRIKFESLDDISPPIIELHIEPRKSAQVKIVITPLGQNTRGFLVLAYPLFDSDGNYIDSLEAEPYGKQEVTYSVGGQASFGMTKQQQVQVKKLGGATVFLGTVLTMVNQFLNLGNLNDILITQGPLLASVQVPFAITYFQLSNRFEKLKQRRK